MNNILDEPPLRPPRNEEELKQFMESMDRRFIDHRIGIPARQLAAVTEVMRAFDLDELTLPRGAPRQDSYEPRDVLLGAFAWFDERYGDSQKVYMGPGHGLVVLKGDVWLIRYPAILGRAGFHTGNRLDGYHLVQTTTGYDTVLPDSPRWLDPELPKYDIFDYVVDLPSQMYKALPAHEVRGLAYVFCNNRLYLMALLAARHREFMEEARSDLEGATLLLSMRSGAPGIAQWSCLQAVEKTFKSFLHHNGMDFPKGGPQGHDLESLAKLVESAGGPAFSGELITRVQCPASVRYDKSMVSSQTALSAHAAATELAGVTAMVLKTHEVTPPQESENG